MYLTATDSKEPAIYLTIIYIHMRVRLYRDGRYPTVYTHLIK